ncbi:hypothetical protein BOX15_Mlig009348g3, partial [Macrostomum lignano]
YFNPMDSKSSKRKSNSTAEVLSSFRLAQVPRNEQFGLADAAGATLVRLRFSGRTYRPDILVPLCGLVTQRQVEHLAQSLIDGRMNAVPVEQPPSLSCRQYPPDRQQFLLLPRAGAEAAADAADTKLLAPSMSASIAELPANAARQQSAASAAADAAGPSGASMAELAAFAQRFRRRREELGYSQLDACLAMERLYKCTISQGMLSRFELADLSLDNMTDVWPLLRRWLADLEARELLGPEAADSIVAAAASAAETGAVGPPTRLIRQRRARRPRCQPSGAQLAQLERHYLHTPHLSKADSAALSSRLGLPKPVVLTWFCNRRQRDRLAAEVAAATVDTFQTELSAAMVTKSHSN